MVAVSDVNQYLRGKQKKIFKMIIGTLKVNINEIYNILSYCGHFTLFMAFKQGIIPTFVQV